MKIVEYEHHGKMVKVREDLKGKHREHCLCWSCQRFNPGHERNCPIANLLYSVCVLANVVTPVWECSHYQQGVLNV